VKARIGIVLQARMGSTRLPGKVLMPLGGTTMLGWIVQRLRDLPWTLVVATSDQMQDDAIVRQCEQMDVRYFRGSETDVLGRYYQCARENCFEHVVRLTADNPFTDVEELRRLIEQHLIQRNDYTHSFGSMPQGVGAEIFTFAALEKSAREGQAPNHREHVNEYIQENLGAFRIGVLEVAAAKRCPDLRLTVDTEDDYRHVCAIAGQTLDYWVGTEEVIQLCSRSA
jgi:spore coat polysaccharide biosynthesis protein SpsF